MEYTAFTSRPASQVIRLPPAKMRAQQLWDGVIDEAVAYKRCRPLFYSWLERAQLRLNSYGEGGAARKRDREEFEGDFGHAAGSSNV